jgi:hypothetical protein
MPLHRYHFQTHWRFESTLEEIYAILENAPDLARWWPDVYLRVDELDPGDAGGVGKRVRLHTRGWLPYTLNWEFVCTESDRPHGFSLRASGDFEGTGVWRFVQSGRWVEVTYDWDIVAEKPLLRYLSVVLKPIFAANHRWAMRRGEVRLREELARRHAA